MKLKSNPLLKMLIPLLVLAALFISLKACQPSGSDDTGQSSTVVADLSDDELRALGIDGDTPRDTVATLVGQMKQYRQELAAMRTSSAALVKENQRLRERDSSVESRINSAIDEKMESQQETLSKKLQQQQNSLLDSFQQKLSQITQKLPPGSDIPPGLGLDGAQVPDGALRWVEPADAMPLTKPDQSHSSGLSFPSSFASGDNAISQQKQEFLTVAKGEHVIKEAVPVYTLPQNSTLIGSVAMTALLGRVPVNGTVNDPFPFKVIAGRDNLVANGTELPDLEGAVFSGTASGDWTLSCVRGRVHSVTFVFRDGTVRTVPQPSDKTGTTAGAQDSDIGWISDPYGLPCIPGERKSNATEYLSSQFLLAGTSGAAQALASGQTTSTVQGGSLTSALTGSSGQYVLGQALSGGLKESADWFKQRYGQMFDAVYVPPGHAVAVHITQQISVDYQPQGRKVKHTPAAGTKRSLY